MNQFEDNAPRSLDEHESKSQWLGAALLRERLFFYALVVLLVILTAILVWPFLSPILLAIAAVIIVKPLYSWFLARKWVKGRITWATGLTIVISILLIAIPLTLLLSMAIDQATHFFQENFLVGGEGPLERLVASIQSYIDGVQNGEAQDLDELELQQMLESVVGTLASLLGGLLSFLGESLPRFIIEAMLVLVIVMVALPRYEHPDEDTFAALIPFPAPITQLYVEKIKLMIIAMFRGTFVIAFVQGAIMGLVFWIVGVPSAVFLGLVSMFLSVLPVIGVALIAWPVAILLFIAGDIWQAGFIILMLIVVVGNVDTVLRPMLVPEGAYLNPALVLLSVFGGIYLMGIVGALYGPVIVILLVTSIDVYAKYILRLDLEPFLDEDGELDLQKLGLQPKNDESSTKENPITSVVNKLLGRIMDRSGEVEQQP